MTLEYRCSNCGTLLQTTNSDAVNDEIERLRAALEDAVETLESMGMHTDNPLYDRLRAALEQSAGGKE